jgi:hypothetical protein
MIGIAIPTVPPDYYNDYSSRDFTLELYIYQNFIILKIIHLAFDNRLS